MSYNHFVGLFWICVGIYGLLMGLGILPITPRDPAKMRVWRQQYGKLFIILSPVIILNGVLYLLGIFH